MNNYEYCANWVLERSRGNAHSVRVLDYGCGSGVIVADLRKRGIEAFGCDVFYEGGDSSKGIDAYLLDEGVIRKMERHVVPFESNSFDFVVTNQVMEHVDSLDRVLEEIHRVLKPGGLVLSLFPDKGVWREGHCGIAFLHWFPKNSHFRIYYATGLRMLGFGYHKGNKSALHWSRDFCAWLDKWTHYRTRREVREAYHKLFVEVVHVEDNWLRSRLNGRFALFRVLPAKLMRFIVWKLAGMVFVVRKPVQLNQVVVQ